MKTGPSLADIWSGRAGIVERIAGWTREGFTPRLILIDESMIEELEEEIEWIQTTLTASSTSTPGSSPPHREEEGKGKARDGQGSKAGPKEGDKKGAKGVLGGLP